MLLGSEIAIRLNSAGYETVRFYRNAKVGNQTYDIFIEYINPGRQRLQALIDIEVDENIKCSKYNHYTFFSKFFLGIFCYFFFYY